MRCSSLSIASPRGSAGCSKTHATLGAGSENQSRRSVATPDYSVPVRRRGFLFRYEPVIGRGRHASDGSHLAAMMIGKVDVFGALLQIGTLDDDRDLPQLIELNSLA